VLTALTIKDFFGRMAAEPPPGGGSAAALAGLMGVSLMKMAAQVSGKHFPEQTGRLAAGQCELDKLHATFLRLIDEDAQVLAEVLPVLSRPDADREPGLLKDAVRQAIEVPLHIARSSLDSLEIAQDLLTLAAEHVIGDLMLGAISCHTALSGALLMIALNLPLLQEDSLQAHFSSQAAALKSAGDQVLAGMQQAVYQKQAYQLLDVNQKTAYGS
jgi:formiminotetrahydrofolate cyclodeaminase